MESEQFHALQSQLQSSPEFKDRLHLTQSIIHRKNRSVFKAVLDAQDVVIKSYTAKNARTLIRKEVDALQDRGRILGLNRVARVPKVLMSHPDLGFYVLENIDGITGDASLTPQMPPMPNLFPSAATWLSECIKASNDTNIISLKYWEKFMFRPHEHEFASYKHHKIFTQLAVKTLSYVPNATGLVTKTIGHGDFHPGNLIIKNDVVYAIDIQSHKMTPAIREITDFIFKTSILSDTSGTYLGIDPKLIAPFKAILGEGELERLLPFFLGIKLMDSLRADGNRPLVRRAIRDNFAQRFLEYEV